MFKNVMLTLSCYFATQDQAQTTGDAFTATVLGSPNSPLVQGDFASTYKVSGVAGVSVATPAPFNPLPNNVSAATSGVNRTISPPASTSSPAPSPSSVPVGAIAGAAAGGALLIAAVVGALIYFRSKAKADRDSMKGRKHVRKSQQESAAGRESPVMNFSFIGDPNQGHGPAPVPQTGRSAADLQAHAPADDDPNELIRQTSGGSSVRQRTDLITSGSGPALPPGVSDKSYVDAVSAFAATTADPGQEVSFMRDASIIEPHPTATHVEPIPLADPIFDRASPGDESAMEPTSRTQGRGLQASMLRTGSLRSSTLSGVLNSSLRTSLAGVTLQVRLQMPPKFSLSLSLSLGDPAWCRGYLTFLARLW